ncbi:MAG: UUP1 family membrane protein, partial [Gammaproteobacteria bacterium]
MLEGSHLAAAESLLGEVREQSADLDTLVAQLVKRLTDPKPDSNVALPVGAITPDPVKVC